jgi:DNA-binding CsgD family transcriptional regulator
VVVGIFGRDESLRLLAEATAAARAGHGGLVMVRADPGIGVTALLEAHLLAAREAGVRTHRIPVLPPHGRTTLSPGAPPEWTEPAVVVIDDLHRADDTTLLALHELAEELADRSMLVVTGRQRGVAPARFARLDRIAVVHDLGPLDEDAVGALVAGIAGGHPPESLLRHAGAAAGNPWLLSRLAAADRAAEVTAWVAGLAGADTPLARFVAILDQPATVDELAAVTGLAPVEVLAGVGRLAALGLITEKAGLVRLRHPMVRHDVATTSAGLRGPVARTLADRGATPETVAGQLAQMPVDAWTVAWLADHADRLALQPTPALVDLLSRAVAWLPPGNSRLHPMRTALAEALLWSGRGDEAHRTATHGLAAHPDPQVRQRLRAVLAQAALGKMDPTGIFGALDPERVDGKLSGRLAALDAFACLLAGDLAGAERAVEQATPAAAQDPVVEVSLLNVRAIGLCMSRDLVGALDVLDRASALLDIAVTDRGQWLLSRLVRTAVQDLRHDPAALDTVEEARPVAHDLGAGWLAWLHTVAALAMFNNGRWDEALAEIDAAMAMPDQYGMARPLHGVAAMILLHRGDVPAARRHIERADQPVGHGVAAFYEQILVAASVLLAEMEGDSQRALEIVRTVAEGGVGVDYGSMVTAVGTRLVRIAIGNGDQELATQLFTEIRQRVSDESPGQQGALLYCQGMIEGDADLLLAAAEEFGNGGSPIAAARAAECAAMVLAASGKPTEARTVYRTAIDRYTGLAAAGDIDRADAELRALGVRRGATEPRGRPKQGWGSLTESEYRVAELVAQGHTNKEVAARLFVSVRTVDSHVSRVLAKLGYSSRVEVVLKFEQRA